MDVDSRYGSASSSRRSPFPGNLLRTGHHACRLPGRPHRARQAGRLQGQRPARQRAAQRSARQRRRRCDADAVRLRRMAGADEGHRRDGGDDGRSRAGGGRGQSSDVGAADERARRHRAAQSLLLRHPAHLLHARARSWNRRGPGNEGEAALALVGARLSTSSAGQAPQGAVGTSGRAINGTLDSASLAKIVGYDGEQNGAVYKITIGRPDIPLKEMGASINARMGLNTWAAFYGSDADSVVAGDIAMLDREVTPVLKALRSSGLDVVAIHHHMTG